ncbi:MAG: VWA domain-containing protein [Gammaproteobacteria bacterium]|jgi:Ca-activated chloride channel family protein
MVETGFHFAEPLWLWGLLAIPLVIAWLMYSAPFRQRGMEARYADTQLLPHLTGVATTRLASTRTPLIGWALVWSLLCLAMAGPRWDFNQVNPFDPGADLVVLLDISRSMEVTDVNPSRMERALQEVQDLVSANRGIDIGLIAFATVAHVVTPITEDSESLLRQLPAISPHLVQLQGSRLSDALERAEQLLDGQADDIAHNILLISDGDFAETDLDQRITQLRDKGIRFHVLAVGSEHGGPVPGLTGTNREPVLSWVDEDSLRHLADIGGGVFQVAGYRDKDTGAILNAIMAHATTRRNEKLQTLVWNEYFFWLLFPAMLTLLYLYRPGAGTMRLGSQGESS